VHSCSAPGIMAPDCPAPAPPGAVASRTVARAGAGGAEGRAEVAMKTRGEIEAAVCEGMTRFEQDYMGRGPRHIHAYLIGDLLVVRLQEVLTSAEQQLVKSLLPEKGRDLLKEVRTQLIEAARPVLGAMVEEATGTKVVSLHHDISTTTGEEVVLLTLAEAPDAREAGMPATSGGQHGGR
jgi:uncharacterized protein YbcI